MLIVRFGAQRQSALAGRFGPGLLASFRSLSADVCTSHSSIALLERPSAYVQLAAHVMFTMYECLGRERNVSAALTV